MNVAETGNTVSIEDILNNASKYGFKADINTHNKEDWTILHISANEGYYDIAKVVLENNEVDVNARTTN